MKAATSIETKKLFACTECGSMEYSYGHLNAGSSFGPWYCDECGASVSGKINDDGTIDIEKCTSRKIKTLVLLVLCENTKSDKPVYLIVEGMAFQEEGEPVEIGGDDAEYFYNEHTCPWNYLRVPIIYDGDSDPHGIFQHQESIVMPSKEQLKELYGDKSRSWYEPDFHELSFEKFQTLFKTLRQS